MMGVRALQRTQQEASNFLQGMKMRRTERLDYRRLDSGSFDNLQPLIPWFASLTSYTPIHMLPCSSRLLHRTAG